MNVGDLNTTAQGRHLPHKGFIVIAGPIGAGKSTLVESLANEMSVPMYSEPVDHQITQQLLADFYSNMSTYAFPLQMHLLAKRVQQHQTIIATNTGTIQDRSVYEDPVFAAILHKNGHLNDRDYQTYTELHQLLTDSLPPPHLLVYLNVSPATCLQRIKQRNRPYEANIDIEYLRQLHSQYEAALTHLSAKMDVLRLDYEDMPDARDVAITIKKRMRPLTPPVTATTSTTTSTP